MKERIARKGILMVLLFLLAGCASPADEPVTPVGELNANETSHELFAFCSDCEDNPDNYSLNTEGGVVTSHIRQDGDERGMLMYGYKSRPVMQV